MTSCIRQDIIDGAQQAMAALKRHGLTIVTAESCTAGLIASALSQAEGASEILHGGFVTYTKAQKTKALDVSADLLKDKGAVNEEVVCALAQGALAHSNADVALAVSGVLGPDTDEDGNPVGLVCFCVKFRHGPAATECRNFAQEEPDMLRCRAIFHVLSMLTEALARRSVSPPQMA